MNEDRDYDMSGLAEDLEFLRKNNLIEVTGINEDGEWLYALTKEAREKINSSGDDVWCVLHELITEAEATDTDKE
jgi:hypothetical protein